VKAPLIALRRPAAPDGRLSDDAVAAACASGDPAAVAELFERFHAVVARFLSRIVRGQLEVEDLLQATFLEIARGRTRFEGRSSARTWILGISANIARHHVRAQRRYGQLRLAIRHLDTGSTQAPPDRQAEARALLERTRGALDGVSPDRRIAYVLCEVEGLSAREAARVLRCSETAVWKRVSDTRLALRRASEEGR
jgi:RNA polymerase sigma-70 factor (ECF subfamily)